MDFNTIFKNTKEYIFTFIISVILGLILYQFAGLTKVSGLSMYPTLNDKDFLFFTKSDIHNNTIDNGDVIIFDTTPDTKSRLNKIYYIKRVIGKEGDHILIQDGKVFLNEIELDEPYIDDLSTDGYVDIIIPKGEYFVLGDNRDGSSDSRRFGLISHDNIVGVTNFRIFPLNKFGKFDN